MNNDIYTRDYYLPNLSPDWLIGQALSRRVACFGTFFITAIFIWSVVGIIMMDCCKML